MIDPFLEEKLDFSQLDLAHHYEPIDRELLYLKYPKLKIPIPDGVIYYSREEAVAAGAEFYFDKETAVDAVLFFNNELVHAEGELKGELFHMEVWQQFIIEEVYGWKKTENGFRRFTEVFIFTARKQGKSFLGSGMALYALYADGEPGARVVSAAAETDQASLIFETAKVMVQDNPDFAADTIVLKRSMAVPNSGSNYQVLSADAHTKHGRNLSCVVVDEVHTQPNRDLMDVLFTSVGARTQPLKLMFTTAGFDKNTICYEYYDKAKKVQSGELRNTNFFPVIFEPDEGDDWKDQATWYRSNPNLGVSMRLDRFQEEFQKALETPTYENTFKRLHCNFWCVVYETLITMASGERKRADEIKIGDWILSFDEKNHKLVKSKVSAVLDNGRKHILKITTSRGREIRITENHPFWSRYGRSDRPKYGWKLAGELKIGSRIAVALGHSHSYRVGMCASEAQFLGIMVGDGTCHHGLRLTHQDIGVRNFVSDFVEKHGCSIIPLPDGTHWDIRKTKLSSLSKSNNQETSIAKILRKHNLRGRNCYTKRVSSDIFRGGPKVWASFLSGYLDTDGHVNVKGRTIIWVSCNRLLLLDCQHLLALLGVQSSIAEVKNKWVVNSKVGIFRLEVRDSLGLQKISSVFTLTNTKKKKDLVFLSDLPKRSKTSVALDRSNFDRVVKIEKLKPEPTLGIEVESTHTHITEGLITHNTQQETRWVPVEAWNDCAADLKIEDFKGQECHIGVDLASKTDLAAIIVTFQKDDRVITFPYFFIPGDNIPTRVKRDRVKYDVWVRQKLITATPGNVVDYDSIESLIDHINSNHKIIKIFFDPWNAQQLQNKISEKGIECVNIAQTIGSLSAVTKELEALVLSGTLQHTGNEVLTWNFGNVAIEEDAVGNIKPNKKKSKEKIDGVIALVLSLFGVIGKKDRESVYVREDRGIISI